MDVSVDSLQDVCNYTGGMVIGFFVSLVDVPLATMSSDPDIPFDSKLSRTQSRNILKAFKEGRFDGRWFLYVFKDKHFRASLPPSGYLSVHIRALRLPKTIRHTKQGVFRAFQLSKSDRNVDTLLIEANLRVSGLLFSLLDPRDLHVVQEYFNFSAEGKFFLFEQSYFLT
ncbi:hypothetical protein L484_016348 [Morus notabilis]|uniref:Uncharacterized protein n=1 Tax=Morus notabilis TaxID=981085 RepID=W9QE98_9ROSA|nr:hypothetical protein L484_016348 [Morus notabilis]